MVERNNDVSVQQASNRDCVLVVALYRAVSLICAPLGALLISRCGHAWVAAIGGLFAAVGFTLGGLCAGERLCSTKFVLK